MRTRWRTWVSFVVATVAAFAVTDDWLLQVGTWGVGMALLLPWYWSEHEDGDDR